MSVRVVLWGIVGLTGGFGIGLLSRPAAAVVTSAVPAVDADVDEAPVVPADGCVEARRRLAALQIEVDAARAALLDRQRYLEGGDPIPWPADTPPEYTPERVAWVMEAVKTYCPRYEVIAVDCAEAPCIVGLRDLSERPSPVLECDVFSVAYGNQLAEPNHSGSPCPETGERPLIVPLLWPELLVPGTRERGHLGNRMAFRSKSIEVDWPCAP